MSTLYHESAPDVSGIYRITCVPTGKIYIGSAVSFRTRWANHFSSLRRNAHKNPKLQAAWNKYGEQAFTFEVFELVLIPFLLEREQYWLDKLKPFGKNGFNIARVAGSNLGIKLSYEHREKLRIQHLGKKHTDEAKAKMSKSRTGKKRNPKSIEKMKIAQRGRIVSPEHRAKLSASHTGKKLSEETKRKIGNAHKGRKQSPEAIEKTRLAHLGKKRSEQARANMSAAKRGHKMDLTLYSSRRKTLIVTEPNGTEYSIHGIHKFCKEHQLDPFLLKRVAKGEQDHHKGWKARYPTENDE